jgi:hypothetical protein
VAETAGRTSQAARSSWTHETCRFSLRHALQTCEVEFAPYYETLTRAMSEPWLPSLKSKRKFRMNRIAAFTLLVALSVSWSIPAKAQVPGVAEYGRQSRKLSKKAAKEQRKAWKKSVKAQRKALKQANRHTKYSTRASTRFPD